SIIDILANGDRMRRPDPRSRWLTPRARFGRPLAAPQSNVPGVGGYFNSDDRAQRGRFAAIAGSGKGRGD
ncbi:MAG: hypothetical protein ACRDQ2_14540, partial [Gaiellales bacterium]